MVATTIVGDTLDATGLPRGASRWLLFGGSAIGQVAASVNLHGASPWHLWLTTPLCVASNREPPPGKLVASPKFSHSLAVGGSFISDLSEGRLAKRAVKLPVSSVC